MLTGIISKVLFLLLSRDYSYVESSGSLDWALVVVIVLFFVGAEFFQYLENKNKK